MWIVPRRCGLLENPKVPIPGCTQSGDFRLRTVNQLKNDSIDNGCLVTPVGADFVLNLRFQSIEFGDADRIINGKLQGGSLGERSDRQQQCAKRHRMGGLGRLGYVVEGSFCGPECQGRTDALVWRVFGRQVSRIGN